MFITFTTIKKNRDFDFSFLYSINILRFKGLNLTKILELYYFSLTLDIGVHPSSMHNSSFILLVDVYFGKIRL